MDVAQSGLGGLADLRGDFRIATTHESLLDLAAILFLQADG